MKTFKFNHNDYVTVTLTKEGAEHLNRERQRLYDKYPQLIPSIIKWSVEGEIYRSQFWELINKFDEMLHIGLMSPFKRGEITVESSIEDVPDLFDKKVKAFLNK